MPRQLRSDCILIGFWFHLDKYVKVEAIIGKNDEAIMNFEKVSKEDFLGSH